MSNWQAIAAVTATLRNLLTQSITIERDLQDTSVTSLLPDRARPSGTTANQVNLFLYQVVPNPAWRNLDMPRQTRPGESGTPPLALNLYYLLTTYGRDDDASRPFSHELLGRAMRTLHDHPVLGPVEIQNALSGNDLYTQIERIRLTLQPLSVEEVYRLWHGFQTPYRTSVSYEATVVLIDSLREVRTPLPVLTRGRPEWFDGRQDGGVLVAAAVVPPTIGVIGLLSKDGVLVPRSDAGFGDQLTIQGMRLTGDSVTVSLESPAISAPLVIAAQSDAIRGTVSFKVPAGSATFPAGLYSAAASVTHNNVAFTSNALPLALGPQITSGLTAPVAAVNGTVTLKLGCAPDIQPNQRVSLLVGSREIMAQAGPRPANQVTFAIAGVAAGDKYLVRLRVDGADSAIIVDPTAVPPVFDTTKVLTVQ